MQRPVRAALPLLAALLLAGCGGEGTGRNLARIALWPFDDLLLPRLPDEPPARPADWSAEPPPDTPDPVEPAIRLGLGRRHARAVLVQGQGERRLWRSPGGVVAATDGARVVATAGLSKSVTATRFDGLDPLDDPRALVGREAATRRTVDLARAGRGPAGMRFGLALTCRLRGELRVEEDTLLVEERCRGDARFTNRFWADPRTGAVFRSEQWIGEHTAPLRLDVLATGAEGEDVQPSR
jgi:hypothetical protein